MAAINTGTTKRLLYLVFTVIIMNFSHAAKKPGKASGSPSSATLEIEHSFDSVHYSKRGIISVQSLRTPQGQPVQFDQMTLTFEDQVKLKEAVRLGGNYKVRVQSHFSMTESSTSEDISYVYGYTRACMLVNSGLKDHIFIHTDDAGAVMGVSLSTNSSHCRNSEQQLIPKTFSTTVEVNNGEPGSVPDVDGFLRKVAETKEKEKNTDNRSFFQKYQPGSVDVPASVNSTLKKELNEKNTENKPSQDEEGGESDPVTSGGPEDTPLSPEVPEEDGVLLEEGEVDMRAMMVTGRLMRFDLLRLPPQPKTTGQWTMKQVLQDGLPVYPYPVDPRPGQQQQKEENNKPPGSQPPQTPGGATGPPVKITARLPEEFILPSDPTVARWDHHHSHWTTNSVLGVDVNHEEGTFTCQVPTCCPLALMIDTHWNMPYQRWELMPVEENGCLLTVTGAHMEVKINIKNDQCCLLPQPVSQQDEDEEERTEPPLNKLSNKWMSNRELMKGLLSYGINIFPSEDAVKYVDTPNKSWTTEDSLYLHMALLSNVYAFARSRWNTMVPRHQFVMKVTEMAGEKKSNEPQWSLVIGGRRSCRLQMKEEDDQFSSDMAEGCEVHPDLYNALTHDGSPGLSDLLTTTPPVHVDSVQTWLTATRVLRFS